MIRTFTIVLFLTVASSAFANGSIATSEVLKMGKKATTSFLVKNFLLDEVSSCVRMGRQTGLGGQRVLPCTVTGRMRLTGSVYEIEIGPLGEVVTMEMISRSDKKMKSVLK